MMKNKKWLALLLSAAMLVPVAFAGCDNGDKGDTPDGDTGNVGDTNTEAEDTSTKLTGKIYLVGDSTVCSFSDNYYLPRYGYGTQLYNYINCDSNQIVNLALSGRSSISYTYGIDVDKNNKYSDNTSYYEYLTESIGTGDYLFIGFGHNDEKREVARYSDPTLPSDSDSTMIGTYNANRIVSFKQILKEYYIDVALEKGATPVLCTPIVRLNSDSSKYDSDHITSTLSAVDSTSGVTTTWTGGDYAQAIRDLATELNLTLIDLTAETKADYKSLGYDEALKYHAATGAKWTDATKTEKEATGLDSTHTNKYGAKMNAYRIANAIKNSNLPLASNVKTNISKPEYSLEDIVNANYSIPETEPFNPNTDASKLWTGITGTITDETTSTTYKWYGTAFGNSVPLNNFRLTQSTDNNGITFTVSADNEKGKIESGGDILAAVFIQVPYKTAFTVSATAQLGTSGGNQSGFGIMVRDDMYIDFDKTVSSNYVNAGCRCSSTSAIMCYSRVNGSLDDGSKGSLTVGNSYQLSIARTSQSITAKMDSYTYNSVSDFDLAVSDSEYVYVCLWATRGTTVTFSNISFTSGIWEQA